MNATFEKEAGGCRMSSINTVIQSATLLYGAILDLTMMVLVLYKLPLSGSIRSVLRKLFDHPNLLSIFSAFIFNCLATIFIRLNLNAVMASVFIFPSAVFSTINATRCIRRQMNYHSRLEDASRLSTVRFRKEISTDGQTFDSASTRTGLEHIQMQTFDVASETTYQRSDGSMEKFGYKSSTTGVGTAH